MPTYPFEATFDDIVSDSGRYVDAVFSCLESEFLVMPKGTGFVEYPVFERGYEALKAATKGFTNLDPGRVFSATQAEPISIVVLRERLSASAAAARSGGRFGDAVNSEATRSGWHKRTRGSSQDVPDSYGLLGDTSRQFSCLCLSAHRVSPIAL